MEQENQSFEILNLIMLAKLAYKPPLRTLKDNAQKFSILE